MKRLHEISLLPLGTLYEVPITGGPRQRMVYQRVLPPQANAGMVGQYGLQLRRHVIPADPRSPAQVARREQFANAVAAWQQLSPAEKVVWQRAARNKQMSGYNHFLGSWLRGQHPPSEWDGGATTWDGGDTVWDPGN